MVPPQQHPLTVVEALQKLERVQLVFGLVNPAIVLDADLRSERRSFDLTVADIVKEFDLKASEAELRVAILASAETYWTWWAGQREQAAGLGYKADIDLLVQALMRVEKCLEDQKVRNRLERVVKTCAAEVLPPSSAAGIYYAYTTSNLWA